MPDARYPHGKRLIRFFKRAGKYGLQAEINPALPHIEVSEDGTVAEVSAELAWSLLEQGRAESFDPEVEDKRTLSELYQKQAESEEAEADHDTTPLG